MNTNALKEICSIYYNRNLLARSRDKARHKYRYLLDVKRFKSYENPAQDKEVQEYKRKIITYNRYIDSYSDSGSYYTNDKVINLTNELNKAEDLLMNRIREIKIFKSKHPISGKWKDVSKSDLNMLILEADALTTKLKIDIMKHTKANAKRLKELNILCAISPKYVCGVVSSLRVLNSNKIIHGTEMKQLHNEYLADLAIETMLSEAI